MDIAEILRDILIVLVAAKLAAEIAERIGIPAVVGEIVAGILIGPSVLGLVGSGDEVLRTLGEIGVILLLLDVGHGDGPRRAGQGRHGLDARRHGRRRRAARARPRRDGAHGRRLQHALFIGAALTATSVGITARVFGDLRALATTEARIVLGAAVADDVMGLVVLTVVVRLVTEGSVSVLSVRWIVVVAVPSWSSAALVGLRVAPPLFDASTGARARPGRWSRWPSPSPSRFAELADAAKLAPIVGAFVAGIALSQTRQRDRIRRELAPGRPPVHPGVLPRRSASTPTSSRSSSGACCATPAILLVVAVVGKLVVAARRDRAPAATSARSGSACCPAARWG